MNMPLTPRRLTLSLCLTVAMSASGFARAAAPSSQETQTPPASQAAATPPAGQASQANDGSDYIAAWSVMGEICEVKYPDMKPAIDEFWTTRWNKATRERVAKMKEGADFQAKVAKHRVNLNQRKDEILAQCGRLFTGGAH